MITIDHLLIGIAVSLPTNNPQIIGISVIGSILPDLDCFFGRPGSVAYLKNHRTFTHSLFLSPVFAFGAASIFGLLFGYSMFFMFWLWCLIGLASHLLVDVFNSFGTMIYYPFSKKKISLDLIYEFDPAISFILLFICIGLYFNKKSNTLTIFLASVFIILLYYLMRYRSRIHFIEKIKHAFPEVIRNSKELILVPAKYWRWKGITIGKNNHHIFRKIKKKITLENRTINQIPENYLVAPVKIYKNYARVLDVHVLENELILENLIYSHSVYKMSITFTKNSENKISVSLPNLDYDDY